MPSCVVDASALVAALTDRGPAGERIRTRLRSVSAAVPDYCAVEVASAVRGRFLGGRLGAEEARTAIADLGLAPVDRYNTLGLLPRIWELRDNLAVYDAGYVALAEALDCPLITADRRLAHTPGIRCAIETV